MLKTIYDLCESVIQAFIWFGENLTSFFVVNLKEAMPNVYNYIITYLETFEIIPEWYINQVKSFWGQSLITIMIGQGIIIIFTTTLVKWTLDIVDKAIPI